MDVRHNEGYTSTALHQLRRFAVKVPSETNTIAFSYLRFSSPAQAEGDSVRRQESLRDAWLKRNPHVKLDTSLTLVDAGVSGYTGKHRTNRKHALAVFVDLVKEGRRVPSGSYLIVENLDRLTRETPVDAIPAVLDLIKSGVRVVQLAPTETVYDAEMDQGRLMMMLWELSRGNAESKRKSGLCGEAWKAKKDAARSDKTPHGKMCPAWLELIDGKYRVKADAAKAVRRVFQLCADGVGAFGILERLNKEGVPPIGRSGAWERSYVKKLLRSTTVLGTYQPMKGHTRPVPEGEPIPNYYPSIISESLWYEAQEAMKNRTRRSGRPAKQQPNPFAGLLHCALEGCPLHVSGTRGHKYLVSAKAMQKATGAEWRAFPLPVFTSAVLNELAELKAADLFADPGAETLVALQTQLADVERRLTNATARFEADPESQQWQNLVSKYDKEKRVVVKELAEERQRSANPLSATWTEAVELMSRNEPERLRQALLAVVEGVWTVTVVVGGAKLMAVQVWFRGGGVREYALLHRPHRGSKKNGKPSLTEVKTFADAGLTGDDLRDPEAAKRLEQLLVKHLSKLSS